MDVYDRFIHPETLSFLKDNLKEIQDAKEFNDQDYSRMFREIRSFFNRNKDKSHPDILNLLSEERIATESQSYFMGNINVGGSKLEIFQSSLQKSISLLEKRLSKINSTVPVPNVSPTSPIYEHLEKSKKYYESKDYKNSIKESICAVETILKEVSGDSGADFGEGIKKSSKKLSINAFLQKKMLNIYDYSSSVGGVRHGNKPMSNKPITEHEIPPDSNDALLILKDCQNFIEYLENKQKKLNK